jgi:hypothetical protein
MRWLSIICVLLTVSPVSAATWQNADVPSGLTPAGSALETPAGSGTWTVKGAGDDIGKTQDGFHFLFGAAPLPEDFAVSCRLVSLGDTPSPWGKAGLMARAGSVPFDGRETFAMAYVSTGSGAGFNVRDGVDHDATYGDTGSLAGAAFGSAAVWLKLVRVGDSFASFAALDWPGIDRKLWVGLGTYDFAFLVGDPLYVGLAVTAHNAELAQDVLATAVFDSINLEDETVSGAGPVNLVCGNDGPTVKLMWENRAVYDELALYRENLADHSIARIATTLAPNAGAYADTPPADGFWRYWLAAVHNQLPCTAATCTAGAWYSADIADSGLPGTVSGTGTALAITGSGHDIGDAADDFRFVWREFPATAHVTIQARLDSFDYNQREFAKAGLMFRTFETEGSPFVFGVIRPDDDGSHDRALFYREASDRRVRQDLNRWNPDDNIPLPYWIRAVYANEMVTVSFARDDAGRSGAWESLDARKLELHGSATILGGLAVTSNANWLCVTAEFSHIEVVEGEGRFIRGDANIDGRINVSDPVYTLRYIYTRDRQLSCVDAGDSNDDGVIDSSDVIYTLNYLFISGTVIPPPLQACGSDPSDDGLTCQSYPTCE